jgi:hypothetical protein
LYPDLNDSKDSANPYAKYPMEQAKQSENTNPYAKEKVKGSQ